jgi:serine protease Do
MRGFAGIMVAASLGFSVTICACAMACMAHARPASAAVVQQSPSGRDPCGWIGVSVSPMTAAFAESLGLAQPYGAIFDQPQPGSPAAAAGIEQGDVLTAINGSPLM